MTDTAGPDSATIERTYTSVEVCTLTGCSYRQLDHWDCCGWLGRPQRAGSGRHRSFTTEQVETVWHAVRLCRAGFTASEATRIAAFLATSGEYAAAFGTTVLTIRVSTPIPMDAAS